MQALLDLPALLLGAADQQLVEGRAPEAAEEDVGGVLDVVVGLLLDAALVTRLGPAALVVPAVDVVGDAGDLLEAVARAAQDPGHLAADQEDAPAAGEGEVGERLDEGRAVDRDAGVHRARQLDHLEEVRRTRAEDRQAVGALRREVRAAEVLADALDVLAQMGLLVVRERVAIAQAAVRLVEQGAASRCCAPGRSRTRWGRD